MTDEIISEVQALAEVFFTPEDIQIVLDLSEDDLQRHEFKLAYKRGQLISETKLRKSIIQLANQGSSPAQNLALKILEKTKLKEIANG